MQIMNIMTTDIISVNKNDDLQHVMDLMEKHNISKVPAMADGTLAGIVTDNKIADELGSVRKRGVTPAHMHASTVMNRDFEPIYPQMDVREILRTVGEPGLTMLPVLENEMLVGVVTKADLLSYVEDDRSVVEAMTGNVVTVKPDDRIVHARRRLLDHDIARLPVVVDGEPQGIISDMEIAFALAELKRSVSLGQQNHRLRELLVEDAMRAPALVAGEERTIAEAAGIMLDQAIGCLPIVDESDALQGIVTRTNLVRTLPDRL